MAKSGRPAKNTSAAVTVSEEVKTPETVTKAESEVKEKTVEDKKTDTENTPKAAKPIAFVDKVYNVENKDLAGRSVYGTTGELITFDENGKTKAGMKDAEHFSRIPGFVITE